MISRVPPGVPTGGQFAEQAKGETDLNLSVPDEDDGPVCEDCGISRRDDQTVVVRDPGILCETCSDSGSELLEHTSENQEERCREIEGRLADLNPEDGPIDCGDGWQVEVTPHSGYPGEGQFTALRYDAHGNQTGDFSLTPWKDEEERDLAASAVARSVTGYELSPPPGSDEPGARVSFPAKRGDEDITLTGTVIPSRFDRGEGWRTVELANGRRVSVRRDNLTEKGSGAGSPRL